MLWVKAGLSVLLIVAGVFLCYLGVAGSAEVTMGPAKLTSNNLGALGMFLGTVLAIATFGREPTGRGNGAQDRGWLRLVVAGLRFLRQHWQRVALVAAVLLVGVYFLPGRITVFSAKYMPRWGEGGSCSMMKRFNTDCVGLSQCRVACDNDHSSCGDPAVGTPKKCVVRYACGPVPLLSRDARVNEGGILDINCSSPLF